MVSLHKYCKTTPVLKALGIYSTIQFSVDIFNLELLRSIFSNNSRARSFYMYLLNTVYCDRKPSSQPGLLSRTSLICDRHNIIFLKYIFNKDYASQVKSQLKKSSLQNDGLSDSVRVLLLSADPYDKFVLNMLLTPF